MSYSPCVPLTLRHVPCARQGTFKSSWIHKKFASYDVYPARLPSERQCTSYLARTTTSNTTVVLKTDMPLVQEDSIVKEATFEEDGAPKLAGLGTHTGGLDARQATMGPPMPTKRKSLKKSKHMSAMAAGIMRVQPASGPGTVEPDVSLESDLSSETMGVPFTDNVRSNPSVDAKTSDVCAITTPIFVMSDCTGESAAKTVRGAFNQFEQFYKTNCSTSIVVFRFLEDEKQIHKVIEQAAKEHALVVYTLVDPKLVKAVLTACQLFNVRYVDLWSTLLDNMEQHLNVTRSGVPPMLRASRQQLSDDYFKLIEAVEYTRKMDDGASAKEWKRADVLILGVSRSGKTPLSIYLGQRGYKVANLPLVPNCPLPRELFEIDQSRVIGLTIDPAVLCQIRRNRMGAMGVEKMDYGEIKKIKEELEWAHALYNRNPRWPILDVSYRGVEETAARVMKILDEQGGSHPSPL